MKTILTVCCAALLLSGCGTAALGVDVMAVTPSSADVPVSETNFVLGQSRTAVVGEQVVRVKDYVETRTTALAVRPDRQAAFSMGFSSGLIFPDRDYPVVAERMIEGRRLRIIGIGGVGIQIYDHGRAHSKGLYESGYGTWSEPLPDMTLTPADVFFAPSARITTATAARGENYEIVFTGRDASSMRFQYREYTSDDMARPAFSQDLTYPATARTVRFRGLTLEIGALGEDSITYTVTGREPQQEANTVRDAVSPS